MSRAIVLPPCAVAVALGVPLASPPPAPAKASFVSTLKVPGHHPRADRRWPVRVTARTRSGKPLRATALYLFLYDGQVVSRQGPTPNGPDSTRPYSFTGVMRDPSFTWPARAVGYRLTLRVQVRVRGRGTRNHDYWVRVRR
jgi:hypothetical protein